MDVRGAAIEGGYFHTEGKIALERHVERLVREGKLPQGSLSAIQSGNAAAGASSSGRAAHLAFSQNVPTTVRNVRHASEVVYNHKKGMWPGTWGHAVARSSVARACAAPEGNT